MQQVAGSYKRSGTTRAFVAPNVLLQATKNNPASHRNIHECFEGITGLLSQGGTDAMLLKKKCYS
eukprot:1162033-Pelagomonas_calceolata.AAC.1